MDLVLEYVEAIQEIDEIEESGLDDKKKVKRNNKLADQIRKIASEIDTQYPNLKPTFYQLLFHEKPSVRIWAAHHVLEVMNYNDDCKTSALKEILYVAEHSSGIDGLGNKMWLTSWLNEHPEDKDLL